MRRNFPKDIWSFLHIRSENFLRYKDVYKRQAMLAVDLVQEKQPVRALIAKQNTALRWLLYLGILAGILIMGTFSISMTGGFAYAQF